MLLSSVIIILREVLEAALLLSILTAMAKELHIDRHWITWSLLMGFLGSIVYAFNTHIVSEWFQGVGQEVVNALMQMTIYFMLFMYLILLTRFLNHQKISKSMIALFMIVISTLAITREGSEIILYFFSITGNDNHLMAVLVGMAIGASIGVSVGLLFYYFLINLHNSWSVPIGMMLLILVAAGMVSQASLSLIQADWLPSQLPVWDTSDWLSESSALGQLLYALIGYEATPTALQMILYVSGLVLPVIIILVLRAKYTRGQKHPDD